MTKEDEVPAARRKTESAVDPQEGMFDDVISNDVLEKALERRQTAREKVSKATGEYRKADEGARTLLPEIEVDQVVRCGRFRIRVSRRSGRSVAFETEPKEVTTIGLIED